MPIQEVQITRDDGKIQVNETNGLREKLAAWGRDQQFSIVGKPQTRLEGPEKVTGRARYSYDVRLPGQLFAAVLRSPPSPRAHPLHQYGQSRSAGRRPRDHQLGKFGRAGCGGT